MSEKRPSVCTMRGEYNFSDARENPYAAPLKKSITIEADGDAIEECASRAASSVQGWLYGPAEAGITSGGNSVRFVVPASAGSRVLER